MSTTTSETINVPLTKLHENPENVRTTFDEAALDELAASIESIGLLSPLTVREVDGSYQILAGARRYRALLRTNIKSVPVIVRKVSDGDAMALMLIENIQREDINPVDEARGFLRLVSEFGYKQKEVAAKVGKSEGHISKRLSLLQLSDAVLDKVAEGTMPVTTAEDLAKVPASERGPLEKKAIKGTLSDWEVDSAIKKVQRLKDSAKLAKVIESYGVKITTDYVPYADRHLYESNTYHLGNVKEWTPKRGDVAFFREGDTSFTTWRKLTAAELKAKTKVEVEPTIADEHLTPHDIWKRVKAEHAQLRYASENDWGMQIRARSLTLLDEANPQLLAKYAVQSLVQNVCEDALWFFQMSGRVLPLEFTEDQALEELAEMKHGDVLRIYFRAMVRRNLEDAAIITTDAERRLEAEGATRIAVPEFVHPEPWIDENGEWVTDRPQPAPHGINEITGEPISDEEAEAIAAVQAEAAAAEADDADAA